jgi:hypothetical protein
MVFPLVKIVILTVRYTARPIANALKAVITNTGMCSNFMVYVGDKAYAFEYKINEKLIAST